MKGETRHYTIRIEVEIHNQDDFANFQPDTVTARAPQLGVGWVSSNDGAALHDFFAFFLNWSHVKDQDGALKCTQEIARRALDGKDDAAEVERLQAENADLLAKNANMVEELQAASKELLEVIGPRIARREAAALAIVQAVAHYGVGGFMPAAYVEQARAILAESEIG